MLCVDCEEELIVRGRGIYRSHGWSAVEDKRGPVESGVSTPCLGPEKEGPRLFRVSWSGSEALLFIRLLFICSLT